MKQPIDLLEKDAERALDDAKAFFKYRLGREEAARARITYAKFLRDLFKGTFLSGDDLRHGRQKSSDGDTPSEKGETK